MEACCVVIFTAIRNPTAAILAAVAVSLVAVPAIGGAPSPGTPSTARGDASNPSQQQALAQIKRLGGRLLTAPGGGRSSWAPDSARIVFSNDKSGLSILQVNTGEVTELVVPGNDPAWSPDGDTQRFDPAARPPYQSRVGRRGVRRGGGAEFGVVCFGAIFLIVIVVALLFGASRSRNTSEAYAQLARHYGGTCNPGGLLARPRVQFPYAGTWVVVDVYSTGGKHATYYTQVHFALPQPGVRCEVYPERMWSRVGKLMGMEDVEIGSPAFDDRYIIKGSSPALLRNLLTPAVQHQIEQLRQFLGNGDVYVSFDRRELLVKKLSYIRDFRTLYQFTQLAIALYTQSVRPSAEGIEFVKDAATPKLKEAVCQICGETIESDVVFCRRCRTPHHHDCWEYYGACSTYGCRETRCLRPESRRAQRVQGSNRLAGKMRR